MLDGEVIEELRRCSVCEVRRPLSLFTRKVQTERNGSVGSYVHNACVACSSGSSKPQRLKRAGAPIAEVQAVANAGIDRIRAKRGMGAWDQSTHRSGGASAESVFDWRAHPIVKMCKCCQEVRPHVRASSAKNRIEFVSSAVTCLGCYNAEMRSENSFLHLTMDERREKRDVSEILARVYADRKARDVSWCSTCRQEHDVVHFARRKSGALGSFCFGGSSRHDVGVKEGGRNLTINTIAARKLLPLEEIRRLSREATLRSLARKAGKPQPVAEHVVAPVVVDRPPPPTPSLDAYIASRQESFERAEAAPKKSRQQRRAAERRMVKDAVSASKRVMTDVEIVKSAIGRAMAAKGRAAGGTKSVRRTISKKAWSLDPAAVGAMLKAQGYRCALTGEPFQESTGYGSMQPFAPSPNRINPGGDYAIENCEFVTWWVNRLIGDMPRDLALDFLRDRGLLNEKGLTRG